MTANVGTVDRTLRIVAGAVLVLAALFSGIAFFDAAVLKYGAVIIGLMLMATGAVRFCPLYTILGIRTCKI